jgi:hypothetical protein
MMAALRCAVLLVGSIVLLGPAGCGSSSSPPATPSPTVPEASGPKSIRVLSTNIPPTILAGRVPKVLTIQASITGVALDVNALGSPPKDSQGNIQAYLDRIPPAAYHKPTLTFPWLFQVASPTITFRMPAAVLHSKPGQHRILLALARNNAVLYNVPPAAVSFTLK